MTFRSSSRRYSFLASLAVAMTLACSLWPSAPLAAARFISLGTGPVSGLYYPSGQAICDIVNAAGVKAPARCSIEATPGSVYNVEAIATGENDFALVQSDVQFFAAKGGGRWAGQPVGKLRAVMSLYPELVTLIAKPDAGIASIADLKGKRVNIGAPGSGTRATWEILKAALGLKNEDLAEAAELKPDAAAERICADTLDASLLIVGHPSKMVESQLGACGLTLVPVDGEAVNSLVASTPYYVKGTILSADYRLPADTASFGGKTTLVTSADVPDDVVYELTMAIMKNLERLKRLPSLARLDPKEMASQSLTAPMHTGAERAFRELGLLE